MLISTYQDDDRVWHVTSPSLEVIQSYAAAASEGAYVAVKMGDPNYRIVPAFAHRESGVMSLTWERMYVASGFVELDDFSLNLSTGEITVTFRKYPAD